MPLTPDRLLREIEEQPALLRAVLASQPERLAHHASIPLDRQRLIGVAEGSSRHALAIAAPFLEAFTGLPFLVSGPEDLLERQSVLRWLMPEHSIHDPQAFYLFVSQSGETASVLRAVQELFPAPRASSLGSLPVAMSVTNQSHSTLARRFERHVTIGAGEERSIAATKTLTATLMTLLLWGAAVGRCQRRLSASAYDTLLAQFSSIPVQVAALFTSAARQALLRFSQKLMEVNHFVLLSKGPTTLILPEAGLKLTETSSNIVYTDNAESFKHGPKVILSGVNGHHPNALYLVPPEATLAEALYRDAQSHFWRDMSGPTPQRAFEDDRVFFIRFENSPPLPSTFATQWPIPEDRLLTLPACGLPDSLFVSLVAFQLISCHLAAFKGENPDNPTLQKAVTT